MCCSRLSLFCCGLHRCVCLASGRGGVGGGGVLQTIRRGTQGFAADRLPATLGLCAVCTLVVGSEVGSED